MTAGVRASSDGSQSGRGHSIEYTVDTIFFKFCYQGPRFLTWIDFNAM